MSTLPTIQKSPYAELYYFYSWHDWLESGDSIAESTWDVPPGLTGTDPGFVNSADDHYTYIKLAGGDIGESHKVVNKIATSTGLREQQTLVFEIAER
jgi:hypothetical protein